MISFVVPEIFNFSYYANLVTDDPFGCATTVVWDKIKNISANNEAMQLKLGRDQIYDSTRQNIWSYLISIGAATNSNIWFLRGRDQNRACSHSNILMCTICYISYDATSLPSFNSIASLLAEIFLILCHTTVVVQPMTSSVANLHNRKTWISLEQRKISEKEKRHFTLL